MVISKKGVLSVIPAVLLLILFILIAFNLSKKPTADGSAHQTGTGGNSIALAAWQSSLLERSSSPATWVAIGESITEGQGAPKTSDRWLDLTAKQLQTNYSILNKAGSASYTPAIYRVEPPASPWTDPWTTSKGNITPVYNLGDLGYRALELSSGARITYQLNGSSADLWYASGPGLGKLQYKVDNAKLISINTNTKSSSLVVEKQAISLGAGQKHTITISAGLKPVYLDGFTTYTASRSAGIQVYDSGYGGATAATFLQDPANFKRSLALTKPNLVTIELGVNDYEQQTPPAVFKARILSLIETVMDLPSRPSVELIIPYQIYTKNKPAYAYSLYVGELREIASENSNRIAELDLSVDMPPASLSGQGDYSTDGIHPNLMGQQVVAGLVYKSITH
jgi:lysophospholipase L1-like esterase